MAAVMEAVAITSRSSSFDGADSEAKPCPNRTTGCLPAELHRGAGRVEAVDREAALMASRLIVAVVGDLERSGVVDRSASR
jgi:hypothetical protein